MGRPAPAITPARIERAMMLCAYLVARDDEGEVYAPILERLEAELAGARASEGPRDRARRLLESRTGSTARAGRPMTIQASK